MQYACAVFSVRCPAVQHLSSSHIRHDFRKSNCTQSMFILNINQLDALNFIISLFEASTCFEHHLLIVRRPKFYYTASGIITPIGGRPVHRLRDSDW